MLQYVSGRNSGKDAYHEGGGHKDWTYNLRQGGMPNSASQLYLI